MAVIQCINGKRVFMLHFMTWEPFLRIVCSNLTGPSSILFKSASSFGQTRIPTGPLGRPKNYAGEVPVVFFMKSPTNAAISSAFVSRAK
jgi:hypothetical protein